MRIHREMLPSLVVAVLAVVVLAVAGCRPPQYDDYREPTTYTPSSSSSSSGGGYSGGGGYSSPAPAPMPAPAPGPSIQRTYSPTGGTELEVVNDYPVTQHIWVDGTYLGAVATGQSMVFRLDAGTHSGTSADSSDPTDNPITFNEHIGSGIRLTWRIYQEFR